MADQNEESKNNIDLNKILLPNKEVHTPASAERVNAGVLLAQEQEASTEGIKPQESTSPAPAATPASTPKKEESIVQPIQTYKSDVESLVQTKDVSVVSIAAAEAERREQKPLQQEPIAEEEHWILKRASLVIGGVLLLAIAGGTLAYVLTRPTTVPVTPLATAAPFITVDDTVQVPVDLSAPSASIMNTLNSARLGVNLSLGLIERLYVTTGSGSGAQEAPIQSLLAALAPEAPQALIRTLTGKYLLGVHSYDENQAVLILGTDSYETAYAAMLQWEPTMSHDLLPLFARTPPVHIQNAAPTASTTATSTAAASSTTPVDYFAGGTASSSTLPVPSAQDSGLPMSFTDRVVENHDARVMQTSQGDILLLWTFLDRNTLVITTNEATLREVISRIAQAPTIPLPQ